MNDKKTWDEFRETGLLWFINRILHLFGWAITVEVDDETKLVTKCYPSRVSYMGFVRESEERGFKKVSKYLKENIEHIDETFNKDN